MFILTGAMVASIGARSGRKGAALFQVGKRSKKNANGILSNSDDGREVGRKDESRGKRDKTKKKKKKIEIREIFLFVLPKGTRFQR